MVEVAMRLRASGVSHGDRVEAIGQAAGVPRPTLLGQILPALEALGWIECWRDGPKLLQVSEQIPPLSELVDQADRLLDVAYPTQVERVVLRLLDETTVMPIAFDRAIELGAETSSEADAERALSYLKSLDLLYVSKTAAGERVVFNPNVWATDTDYSEAALKAEDSTVHGALSGLIEEVSQSPGFPESLVKSTEPKWVNFAVSHGLIHRTLVKTTDGKERSFLFTPHMARNAFAAPSGVDPSGHVRQLVGSMVFANRYSHHQLRWPSAFLRKLLREGEAGDASDVGTDYPMLEQAGIVRVEKGPRYYKLVLLQRDIAERALDFLVRAEEPESLETVSLRDQNTYRHPEQERTRLALEPHGSKPETERILAALRETTGRRDFGR
jgi:hypothetical protein